MTKQELNDMVLKFVRFKTEGIRDFFIQKASDSTKILFVNAFMDLDKKGLSQKVSVTSKFDNENKDFGFAATYDIFTAILYKDTMLAADAKGNFMYDRNDFAVAYCKDSNIFTIDNNINPWDETFLVNATAFDKEFDLLELSNDDYKVSRKNYKFVRPLSPVAFAVKNGMVAQFKNGTWFCDKNAQVNISVRKQSVVIDVLQSIFGDFWHDAYTAIGEAIKQQRNG